MAFAKTLKPPIDEGGRLRPRTAIMLGAPFVAVILFMAATRSSGPQDVGQDEARQLWAESGIEAYELTYTYRGLGPATVLWDGEAVAAYSTDDPRLEDATIYWVETFFNEIDEVASSGDGRVELADFHATLGYPVRVGLDPSRSEEGDEWGFEILELRELASPE